MSSTRVRSDAIAGLCQKSIQFVGVASLSLFLYTGLKMKNQKCQSLMPPNNIWESYSRASHLNRLILSKVQPPSCNPWTEHCNLLRDKVARFVLWRSTCPISEISGPNKRQGRRKEWELRQKKGKGKKYRMKERETRNNPPIHPSFVSPLAYGRFIVVWTTRFLSLDRYVVYFILYNGMGNDPFVDAAESAFFPLPGTRKREGGKKTQPLHHFPSHLNSG